MFRCFSQLLVTRFPLICYQISIAFYMQSVTASVIGDGGWKDCCPLSWAGGNFLVGQFLSKCSLTASQIPFSWQKVYSLPPIINALLHPFVVALLVRMQSRLLHRLGQILYADPEQGVLCLLLCFVFRAFLVVLRNISRLINLCPIQLG